MVDINNYEREESCTYKGEVYLVRDNGAILRKAPEGAKVRPLDNKWTFGKKNPNGYMILGDHRVHIIVATAFLGEKDSKIYVVDHIDTNRCNNRVENLRWLTRLENILRNDITRSKIEFICGSVENFLKDPSLLRGHEHENNNFSWMRTVSKEEAENTLKNWSKILENKNEKNEESHPLGEWMFNDTAIPRPDALSNIEHLNTFPAPINAETKEKLIETDIPYTVSIVSNSAEDSLKIEKKSRKKAKELSEEEKLKKEERARKRREKEEENRRAIKDSIVSIAQVKGWSLENNVKIGYYEADLVITSNGNRIGIRVSSLMIGLMLIDSNTNENLQTYMSKSDFSFSVTIGNDNIHIIVSDESMSVEDFLEAAMQNRIRHKSVTINKLKVRFAPYNCYFCNHTYFVYIIIGSYSDGIDFYNQFDNEIDCFDPLVIESVKEYLASHPEINFPMGEIKPRFSKTIGEEYMSFGCPKCDGLLGSWYLDEFKISWLYADDDEYVHIIELKGEGIKIEIPEYELVK